jgi:hypothetical protein
VKDSKRVEWRSAPEDLLIDKLTISRLADLRLPDD